MGISVFSALPVCLPVSVDHSNTDNTSSDVEKQRLRKQHEGLVGIMHNNPIHAPISNLNPKKIVDVGCGMNADMTVYFAKRFPDAQVYGVDLGPVSIPDEYRPKNVTFIQGNITKLIETDPRLASGSVDFLFSRLLQGGMQNWKEYIECVASLLAPGGMTEMQDFPDFDLRKGEEPAFRDSKWVKFAYENVEKKMGLDLFTFRKADTLMQQSGLVETNMKEYRLNWGTKKDESEEVWVSGGRSQWYAALCMAIENLVADEDPAKKDEIMKDVHERSSPPQEGVYFPFYCAWGKKP